MKINHKKTFIGSLIAFFLGISCCWMSALAIWLGGATVLTSVAHYFGQLQYAIILVGVLLAGYLFYLPHSHIVSTHSKHSFTNQTHYLKILL